MVRIVGYYTECERCKLWTSHPETFDGKLLCSDCRDILVLQYKFSEAQLNKILKLEEALLDCGIRIKYYQIEELARALHPDFDESIKPELDI